MHFGTLDPIRTRVHPLNNNFKLQLGYLIQMTGSCVNQILHSSHSFEACSSQYHLGGEAVSDNLASVTPEWVQQCMVEYQQLHGRKTVGRASYSGLQPFHPEKVQKLQESTYLRLSSLLTNV